MLKFRGHRVTLVVTLVTTMLLLAGVASALQGGAGGICL